MEPAPTVTQDRRFYYKMPKHMSSLTQLDDLAKTIAIPGDVRAVRMPSFPNLERTALLQLRSQGTIPVGGGAKRRVVLFRSPTFPVWADVTMFTGAWSYYYSQSFVAAPPTSATTGSFDFPNEWTSLSIIGLDASFFHRLPLGYARGREWLYAPVGPYSGIDFAFSGNNTGNYTLTYEVFDGSEITSNTVAFSTAAQATKSVVVAEAKGWWRPVSISWSGGTGGQLSGVVAGTATGGILVAPTGTYTTPLLVPYVAPPEILNSTLPYASSRCNAASVLVSNVTAVLNKEGTVLAARVPFDTYAKTIFTSSTPDEGSAMFSIHPKERYYGPLEKGLYMFSLGDEATGRFFDYTSDVLAGDDAIARFNLEGCDYFNVAILSDLDATAGSTMALTIDRVIEFRSSSALFPVGYSTCSLEAYHTAQMALANLGVFYENPVHLSMIGNMVRAAVARVAPLAMPYVRSMALAAADHILSSAQKKVNMLQAPPGGTAAQSKSAKVRVVKMPVKKKVRSKRGKK